MSNAKIQQALGNLFEKQRIVFWYDTQQEFAAEFAALLAGSGGTARMAGHAVQPVALTADDPGTDSL